MPHVATITREAEIPRSEAARGHPDKARRQVGNARGGSFYTLHLLLVAWAGENRTGSDEDEAGRGDFRGGHEQPVSSAGAPRTEGGT